MPGGLRTAGRLSPSPSHTRLQLARLVNERGPKPAGNRSS